MEELNPIRLKGIWQDGYAIDYHVLNSVYLGEDQYGHKQFDTKRTAIGQLVYELKYQNNQLKVEEIIDLISPFLQKWQIKKKIDFIITVPHTKGRDLQPVYEIGVAIAERLDKKVISSVIFKNSDIQSKDLSDQKMEISGVFSMRKRFKSAVNLLVIDDLYQSGRTLTEVVKILKTDINVKNIYVLTMTKTRR